MPSSDYALRVLLKYVLAPTVAAAIGAYKLRKIRRRVAADARVLAAWAQNRGWSFAEPEDARVTDELATLNGFLAEDGERRVGIVVVGQTVSGTVILAETYCSDPARQSDKERGEHVQPSRKSIASRPTTAHHQSLKVRADHETIVYGRLTGYNPGRISALRRPIVSDRAPRKTRTLALQRRGA